MITELSTNSGLKLRKNDSNNNEKIKRTKITK